MSKNYIYNELVPIYDGRKSFYRKAMVYYDDDLQYVILRSYDTDVLAIDRFYKTFVRLWNGYSSTTMRHVNEFCRQFGIPGGGKQWWDSLAVDVFYPL